MEEQTHIHIHILMLLSSISLWLLTTLPQFSHCQPPPPQGYNYSVCKEESYNCGELSNISYPFWGQNRPSYCGGGDSFKLNCHQEEEEEDRNTTTIRIGSQDFTVLNIHTTSYSMRLVRTDLARNVCYPQFNDTYLSPSVFRYGTSVYNITIVYNCSLAVDNSFGYFPCGNENAIFRDGVEDDLSKKFSWLPKCARHIQVPVDVPDLKYNRYGALDRLQGALSHGFAVIYTIPNSDKTSNQWNWQKKVIIGVTSATVAVLLICITIFYFRYKSSTWQKKFWLTTKSNQHIEVYLKNQGALPLTRYKFSDVKKMTNSFKIKLGQGGFGSVYKGNLLTGSLVAVKILNPSKRNDEEFINEVASISKTSHVNVVTLLGFCLEGPKKALIYEFMPNGSLEKFIHRKGHETIMSLTWENLYQIAIGIARGLEYLHRGCNTRILHFDIKPHNILLDENFCPKISDFGLAKLCPRTESIISISNARGTMGYVAPEVLNKHFAGVSHKSDVYSYGMMLLEMVGGRKNINAEASHTSEIYFPHWVYKRLEQGSELRAHEVMITEENEIAKRMTIVGLWCIQTFPNDRPTMSRVIDMLEGNVNSLEVPPKPLLSSPTRSVPESSTS